MYGRVTGVTLVGIQGHPVVVEAYVGRGLPALCLTGLPGASVQDARDRVRPAVESAGLEWPLRRVVVNLSPVDLRKDGPGLDLPIAMSVLAASGTFPAERLPHLAFAGELSLEGALMPTPGILAVALAASNAGLDGVVVPSANAGEAALVEGLEVIGANSLSEVVGYLRGAWTPEPVSDAAPARALDPSRADLSDVRGQSTARRALEVAATGGHNVLLIGSPGAGKTMLARRLPTILPSLSRDEALDVTRLHSVAGVLSGGGLVGARPFRAPHHTISPAGLLGGGSGLPRPGEVSLAHHGVLFLDEVAEFRRDALEGLRQPLESGRVMVTRASGSVEFPARITLVAAANPCPCGYAGDPQRPCRCLPARALAYQQKLSGPLLDRIDIRLSVPRLAPADLLGEPDAEASSVVRERVEEGRERQRRRYAGTSISCNGRLPGPLARREARLDERAADLLAQAVERFELTGRGFDRILKVSRTIADLAASDRVEAGHLAEALSYRPPISDEGLPRAG